jgi:hypothetical protein
MLLARGEAILENTKVRFVNFDSLLAEDFESSLKKTEKITGYLSVAYSECRDVLIIFDGQIQQGLRFLPGKERQVVKPELVFSKASEDPEGVVNYYRTPVSFIELLWDSTVASPLSAFLGTRFIRWNNFLQYLEKCEFHGYLEMVSQGMLGYMSYSQGEIDEVFLYRPLDLSKPFNFKMFDKILPRFIPESDRIKLTFLDIFKDMLSTTYSILVQSDQVDTALTKSLAQARRKYADLLRDVQVKKSGSIDFDRLLVNLETVKAGLKKDAFIGCLIEVLAQRLAIIQELFGDAMLDRTVKELKMVQIYHQQSLQRFGVGEALLALWKNYR